eukprot:12467135-Heterocapsa_arctica.AAC.1
MPQGAGQQATEALRARRGAASVRLHHCPSACRCAHPPRSHARPRPAWRRIAGMPCPSGPPGMHTGYTSMEQ